MIEINLLHKSQLCGRLKVITAMNKLLQSVLLLNNKIHKDEVDYFIAILIISLLHFSLVLHTFIGTLNTSA